VDASLQWVSGLGVLLLAVSLAVVGLTWTTKWRAAVSVALLLQAALLAHIEQALYLLPASSYASSPIPRTHDATRHDMVGRLVGWCRSLDRHDHMRTHSRTRVRHATRQLLGSSRRACYHYNADAYPGYLVGLTSMVGIVATFRLLDSKVHFSPSALLIYIYIYIASCTSQCPLTCCS
jgi:hypothetical protein